MILLLRLVPPSIICFAGVNKWSRTEGDGGEVTFTILLTTTLFSIVVATGFVLVVLVVANGVEALFAVALHIAAGEGSRSAMLQLSLFLFCMY